MESIYREMKERIVRNVWFYFFAAVALALIIASFIVPPTGVIDGSVLAAVGEIFAFAALGTLLKAIDKGLDAKVTHGQTTVTVGQLDDDLRGGSVPESAGNETDAQ